MEPGQRQATMEQLNQSRQQLEEAAAHRDDLQGQPKVIAGHPPVRGQQPEVNGQQEVREDFFTQDLIREVESCNQLISEMSARPHTGQQSLTTQY